MPKSHIFLVALTLALSVATGAFGQTEPWTGINNLGDSRVDKVETDANSIEFGQDNRATVIRNLTTSHSLWIQDQSTGNMIFLFNNEVRFARDHIDFLNLKANGNLGIGTSNPQSKLAVNGTVTAKEVVVTQDDWPDFVFDPGYDLMPLDELATHLEKEGHLPGIPSAEEVARDGVAVGEMQSKLLQKVEELTLYLLELERKNDELRAEVASFRSSK